MARDNVQTTATGRQLGRINAEPRWAPRARVPAEEASSNVLCPSRHLPRGRAGCLRAGRTFHLQPWSPSDPRMRGSIAACQDVLGYGGEQFSYRFVPPPINSCPNPTDSCLGEAGISATQALGHLRSKVAQGGKHKRRNDVKIRQIWRETENSCLVFKVA